ncbi:SnoaL-like domain-containing protein [Halogranum amylolyticum]|uniref:SnoaL-like domain-containing protein n=1 Tax=Halogranum amylolyticum TaxID=660520 RepID=A0A1H8RQK1_9EURY|nr:hypothetical protein [Halogranum amylolyticum]SEO68233.1 SnoaL-like domain-containing protein [Halogranum amylolyticum]
MSAEETVLDYYEALRRGEPLYPYFTEGEDVVKFGIGERLTGYDAVAEGLREQTRTTDDWHVESRNLRVVERDGHAAFSDDVRMEWRDTEKGVDRAFDTRWSGTLAVRSTGVDGDDAANDADDEWLFVGMHVSTAHPVDD